jgi:hypothetical protein
MKKLINDGIRWHGHILRMNESKGLEYATKKMMKTTIKMQRVS